MSVMNVALIAITLVNIRQEREDKKLIEEEKVRQAELAKLEQEGGAILKGVLTEESDQSDQEKERNVERTCGQLMREGCLYCLKWRCLRGSSALNLLDFSMNVLCCI